MMKLMKYPLQFCVILRRSNCVRIVSACLVVLVGLAILIVFDFGSLTYSQLNQIERLRSNGSDSSLDWILKHLSSFSNSTEKVIGSSHDHVIFVIIYRRSLLIFPECSPYSLRVFTVLHFRKRYAWSPLFTDITSVVFALGSFTWL